jgi:hypothetical protein
VLPNLQRLKCENEKPCCLKLQLGAGSWPNQRRKLMVRRALSLGSINQRVKVGFIAMIGFHIFASSALSGVKASREDICRMEHRASGKYPLLDG